MNLSDNDLLGRLQRLADSISESLEAGVSGIRDLEEVDNIMPAILRAVKERNDLRGLVEQLNATQSQKYLVGLPHLAEPLHRTDVVCDGPFFAPPPEIHGDLQFFCQIQCGEGAELPPR